MELLFYRNYKPDHFFCEIDFNLSSQHQITTKAVNVNYENEDEIDFIEVELDYTNKNGYNLFSEFDYITDAIVIVGKNGVGKSTLINQILGLLSATSLDFSYQVLIGKDFIITGNKVKIKINGDTKKSLLELSPEMALWTHNDQLRNKGLLGSVKFIGPSRSFIQQAKTGHILYYSDGFEINNLKSYQGKIYSTEESNEEGQRLLDLSTLNRLVLSNKWGLSSSLKETISLNGLIAFQDYEARFFLDYYLNDELLEKVLPKYIFEKISIRFHFGGLVKTFVDHIHAHLDFETLGNHYPTLNYLISTFRGNSVILFYRELLLSFLLLELDRLVDKNGNNVQLALESLCTQFESAIKPKTRFEVTGKDPTVESIKSLIDDFTEYSERGSKYRAIYTKVEAEIIEFLLSDNEISSQFTLNGLSEPGMSFNLNKDATVITKFYYKIASLNQRDYLDFPFIQMKIDNLSAGETNYIYMVTRILGALNGINSNPDQPRQTVCIVLDEPGNSFHPNWQKEFFNNFLHFIEQYYYRKNNLRFNAIITTHSPFILSDFSNDHIIKLDRIKNQTKLVVGDKPSFGANLYDLLNDSFFLENSFIGDFALKKIQGIIDTLNFAKITDQLKSVPKEDIGVSKEAKALIKTAKETSESIIKYKQPFSLEYNEEFLKHNKKNLPIEINLIGESVIRNKLLSMYNEVFSISDIEKERIEYERLRLIFGENN